MVRAGGGIIKKTRCREPGNCVVKGFGVGCGYMCRQSTSLPLWDNGSRQSRYRLYLPPIPHEMRRICERCLLRFAQLAIGSSTPHGFGLSLPFTLVQAITTFDEENSQKDQITSAIFENQYYALAATENLSIAKHYYCPPPCAESSLNQTNNVKTRKKKPSSNTTATSPRTPIPPPDKCLQSLCT